MSLLTTSEAAARLGIDPSQVRRMAVAELLLGQKYGRAWLFDADEIDRLPKRTKGKPGRKTGSDR